MGSKDVAVTGPAALVLSPDEVVGNATLQAKLLMDIVDKTKCYQVIGNKKYLQVEAWETIGAFNRTHAETSSVTPITDETPGISPAVIGYQAHVQLWRDGIVVGGAIMPCYFSENCCKGKDGDAKHKASMSAAQTFATSKAYRMNYSYVAILAGYQPLPAEEVTDDMRTEGIDKTQHWCVEHSTQFFMKGKMKSHAHPIGDTGEWCHEHTDKDTKQQAQDTPQEAAQQGALPDTVKDIGELLTHCKDAGKDKDHVFAFLSVELDYAINKPADVLNLGAAWDKVKPWLEGKE